jgi:hypothetical protein
MEPLMTVLTRHDVDGALGSVEDHFAAQILGSGASLEEFAQAQAWLVNDEAAMYVGQPLPSGRVAQLVEILSRAEESLPSDEVD